MTRRIDAALNDERIVVAARRVLAEDPSAGMDQVAAAAGVGRATLYRRFSTRDDLLAELRTEARRDALRAVKEARVDEGSATEALERLIVSLLHVADRFAFAAEPAQKRVPDQKLVTVWVRLIERGQASGEFSTGVSARWWLDVVRAHFRQAAELVAAGQPVESAAATVMRALLGGLAQRKP